MTNALDGATLDTEHPERIKKGDKQFIEGLNYEEIEFPRISKTLQ